MLGSTVIMATTVKVMRILRRARAFSNSCRGRRMRRTTTKVLTQMKKPLMKNRYMAPRKKESDRVARPVAGGAPGAA